MQLDPLKLENQLCFPLYACSRQVVKRYTPHLDALGLTYTQYIAMMVLWEHQELSVKEIGRRLYLDSGTMTPVLKRLESLGYISRQRCPDDERCVMVTLTPAGQALREEAVDIPAKVGACIQLSPEDAGELYRLLYLVLGADEQAE